MSFETISGRHKHFKKCLLPTVNLRGYKKLDGEMVKCLKCDHVLSNVTNYY